MSEQCNHPNCLFLAVIDYITEASQVSHFRMKRSKLDGSGFAMHETDGGRVVTGISELPISEPTCAAYYRKSDNHSPLVMWDTKKQPWPVGQNGIVRLVVCFPLMSDWLPVLNPPPVGQSNPEKSVPSDMITVSRELFESLAEYAMELRGEWDWKASSLRKAIAAEFAALNECIREVMSLDTAASENEQ